MQIKEMGGLKAIVISHPHYYTTYAEWARVFKCPVYTSVEDAEWMSRHEVDVERRFIVAGVEEVLEGVRAVKVGGHFEGSLVLHWEKKLFIADSLVTVPVGGSGFVVCVACSETE